MNLADTVGKLTDRNCLELFTAHIQGKINLSGQFKQEYWPRAEEKLQSWRRGQLFAAQTAPFDTWYFAERRYREEEKSRAEEVEYLLSLAGLELHVEAMKKNVPEFLSLRRFIQSRVWRNGWARMREGDSGLEELRQSWAKENRLMGWNWMGERKGLGQ